MLNKKDISDILKARFSADLHTSLALLPRPNEMSNANKAAKIINEAIKEHKKIAIVGDYDCDGVCSSAILDEFFSDIKYDNYKVRIPNRFKDGYGLNEDIIDELDAQLIITVDNGITAFEAAKVCKNSGISLIITDHHMPLDEVPDADVIVNPQCKDNAFPFKEICGAQVAWYLVAALKNEMGLENYDLSKFMDFLALAIIADMMELRDMNRVLVKAGLKCINTAKRACFEAIKEYQGKSSFSFDDISFLITPLINSAGRMDDASVSFYFLRAKTKSEAINFLDIIQDCNDNRKATERELFESSCKNVDENDKVIVTWGNEWHEGVIGIVASRLARLYKRPAIVFSVGESTAKGSARSVGKFDILKLIAKHENMLLSFGGHKGAAGLLIYKNRLDEFKSSLNMACDLENFTSSNDDVLGEICPSDVDLELMDIIDSFGPFGSKNPKPIFCLRGAKIAALNTMGAENSHLRMSLETNGYCFEAVNFNYENKPALGSSADILFMLSRNNFRGQESLQLIVQEILPN